MIAAEKGYTQLLCELITREGLSCILTTDRDGNTLQYYGRRCLEENRDDIDEIIDTTLNKAMLQVTTPKAIASSLTPFANTPHAAGGGRQPLGHSPFSSS